MATRLPFTLRKLAGDQWEVRLTLGYERAARPDGTPYKKQIRKTLGVVQAESPRLAVRAGWKLYTDKGGKAAQSTLPKSITVPELCRLENTAENHRTKRGGTAGPATLERRGFTIANQIEPSFEGIKVIDATPALCDEWQSWLQSGDRNDGKGWRPSVRKHAYDVLRQGFDFAIRRGLISKGEHPFDVDGKELVRPRVPSAKPKAPTSDQAKALLASVFDRPELYIVVVLAFLTGWRRCELIGLRFVDWNAERQRFQLVNSVTRGKNGTRIVQEKLKADALSENPRPRKAIAVGRADTGSLYSVLGLDNLDLPALIAAARQRANAVRAKLGQTWLTDADCILTDEWGEPWSPDVIYQRLMTYLRKAGIAKGGLHNFRRYAGTHWARVEKDGYRGAQRLGNTQVVFDRHYVADLDDFC